MDTDTQATEVVETTTTSTPEKTTKTDDKKSYSQSDLDKLFIERANQAESATTAKILKALGVERLEDATVAIKEHKTLKDSQLSETQRLEKERDEAKLEAANEKAARAAIETERRLEKRDNSIIKAFTTARATNADDLLILMGAKKPELVKAVLNEDGTVNDKALTALIAAAKVDYKLSFVGTSPGSPSNQNGKQSNSTEVVLNRKVQA